MEIIRDKDFEFFKQMMRENRELATLGLKTNSIEPIRTIKVSTENWRAIITESFALTKTKKIYLKRNKTHEIIIGKKYLYSKSKQGLQTISPFTFSGSSCSSLMTMKEVFDYYKIDFLLDYSRCFDRRTTISLMRKNKITNIEQLFKLTYPHIPYGFFKNNFKARNFDMDCAFLQNINAILSIAKNPNIITKYTVGDAKKIIYNSLFMDMVNMGLQLGKKINLLWSEGRIKEEHNKYTKELSAIKKQFVRHEQLNPNERFKKLLPKIFELIDDRYRLFEEGEMMGHCVYTSDTYINEIKSGTGAIYSIVYKNKRYTLEIRYNQYQSKERYTVNQFRAAYNQTPPAILRSRIDKLIKKANEKDKTLKVEPDDLMF